jgi:Glycosyltransferase family 87
MVDVSSRPGLPKALVDAIWLAAIPGALLFAGMQIYVHFRGGMVSADSHAYWVAAGHPETWYDRPPAYRDAYLYSPAFAQLLWPMGRLPWPAFQGMWLAMQAAALFWLVKPLGWKRGATLAPFFVTELLLGNVYLFFAVALALAVGRAPATLALPLLTKIAPGVVGLWFVVRRDWRPAMEAAAWTALVVLVSVAIDADAWVRWLTFLRESSGERGPRVALRLALATVLVWVAARRGWAWLLAPAMILACPVLGGYGPLAVLAALPRLLRQQGLLCRDTDPQELRDPHGVKAAGVNA